MAISAGPIVSRPSSPTYRDALRTGIRAWVTRSNAPVSTDPTPGHTGAGWAADAGPSATGAPTARRVHGPGRRWSGPRRLGRPDGRAVDSRRHVAARGVRRRPVGHPAGSPSGPAAAISSPRRSTATLPPEPTTQTVSPSRIGIRPSRTAAECRRAGRLEDLLHPLGGEAQAGQDRRVVEQDDAVEVAAAHRQRPLPGERRAEAVGDAVAAGSGRPRRARARATRRSTRSARRRRPGRPAGAP